MLDAKASNILDCAPTPAPDANGKSSLAGLPGNIGILTFNTGAKEIGAGLSGGWTSQGSWPNGLRFGVAVSGRAENDTASILRTGDVVAAGTVGGFAGVRLSNFGAYIPSVVDDCKEQFSGDADELANCIKKDAGSQGGLWFFLEGSYKQAKYALLDTAVALGDQLTEQEYGGKSLRGAINAWVAAGRWTLIGGLSGGWEERNTIEDMTELTVRDVVATDTGTNGTTRLASKADEIVYLGEYEEFGTSPWAIDVFGAPAVLKNFGFWTYFRDVVIGGGREDEFTVGLGVYLYKADDPFLPIGAISVEWRSKESDVFLTLSARIGVWL